MTKPRCVGVGIKNEIVEFDSRNPKTLARIKSVNFAAHHITRYSTAYFAHISSYDSRQISSARHDCPFLS
jgi:hypothetical protein